MKRRGMILVVILWITVILAVICMVITTAVFQGQVQLKNSRANQQIDAVGRELLHSVCDVLRNDSRVHDSLYETWATMDSDAVLEDESARINANSATVEMLEKLDYFPPAAVEKFVELRDELKSRQQGSEDCPPAGLCGPIANDRQLADLLELSFEKSATDCDQLELSDLTVEQRDYFKNTWMYHQDIKPQIIYLMQFLTVYSRQENVDSQGVARLNINTADPGKMLGRLGDVLSEPQITAIIDSRKSNEFASTGELLIRNLEYEEADVSLSISQFVAICDRISITSDPLLIGLINVNTADIEVLKTIDGISEFDANSIIGLRKELGGSLSNPQFDNPGWLLGAISPESFARASNFITSRSSQFRYTNQVTQNDLEKGQNYIIFTIFERGVNNVNPLLYLYWRPNPRLADD